MQFLRCRLPHSRIFQNAIFTGPRAGEANNFCFIQFYLLVLFMKKSSNAPRKRILKDHCLRVFLTVLRTYSTLLRLTGKTLYVEDRLFATLDASAHFCRLPSGSPIYFADTIGFISDLPLQLFASFEATLSHVVSAVSFFPVSFFNFGLL